jgi:hypothetical protein
MKNAVFWDVTPCGSWKIDVSDELSPYIIRVTRIGELGITLAVTSSGRTQRLLVVANLVPSSPILIALMMGALHPPKRRFLQEPHGVTSQKTALFAARLSASSIGLAVLPRNIFIYVCSTHFC